MSYKVDVWNYSTQANIKERLTIACDRISRQNIEIARLRKENEALRIKLEEKPMGKKAPEDWTLDEVVGALEHCGGKNCKDCPLYGMDACGSTLMQVAAKMLREMAG